MQCRHVLENTGRQKRDSIFSVHVCQTYLYRMFSLGCIASLTQRIQRGPRARTRGYDAH